MRTLKILILVFAAPVFAIGTATIFTEAKKRITKEASADLEGCEVMRVSESGRFDAKIVKIPDQQQTMIQILDGSGNQFDVTCSKGRMVTSHVVTRDGTIYSYFDRDGDGMPEVRSRKDPKTRESVFEHLESFRWALGSPAHK